MFNRKVQLANIKEKLTSDGYKLYRGSEKLDPEEIDLEKERGFIVDDKYRMIFIKPKNKADTSEIILLSMMMIYLILVLISGISILVILVTNPDAHQQFETPQFWGISCLMILSVILIVRSIRNL